jgi:hypothetical protein
VTAPTPAIIDLRSLLVRVPGQVLHVFKQHVLIEKVRTLKQFWKALLHMRQGEILFCSPRISTTELSSLRLCHLP